jgi:hypothetical protein
MSSASLIWLRAISRMIRPDDGYGDADEDEVPAPAALRWPLVRKAANDAVFGHGD